MSPNTVPTSVVNDRKYVFHFRPKPKPVKHLALGRILKPKVQIYVKIGGILLEFNVSNDLSNFGTVTQCSVDPTVPVLLTAKPLRNLIFDRHLRKRKRKTKSLRLHLEKLKEKRNLGLF